MLIICCGIPASGKTTLSNKIAEQYNAVRYSFDEMCCIKHTDLFPHIFKSLENGNDVVVDSVYAFKKIRMNLLEFVQHFDCKKIIIYMTTPLDECIKRNIQRPHPLPQYIIEESYRHFQLPTLDEGWDEIIYI